jgi:hypothetical protein
MRRHPELFDAYAHAVAPGFRAENAGLQLQLGELDAHLVDGFTQVGGVGGGADEHGGAEVLHHHDLPLRVAAGHGDHHRAETRSSLMQAETAREQAVTVSHLDDVVRSAAAGRQAARHHFRPDLHVVRGIAGDDGLAGGAGGAMDADDVPLGSGQQPEGILVPQVRLLGKWQIADIVYRFDVAGLNPDGVPARPVEGDVLVHALHGAAEPLPLELGTLVAAHTLIFLIVDPVSSVHMVLLF